ncbi:antitoxin [Actinomadura gamaensis]|uniref:Antitoxin n=1 Tax=Actinomadura gamaensis TaxID=1763541 RepID=A0ABV9TQX2_9ACTN
MSILDKVKQMLGQNADAAKGAVDKAGDMLDDRTGGKYADKVDKVQDRAKQYIEGSGAPGQQTSGQGQDAAQDPQQGAQPNARGPQDGAGGT